LPAPASDAGPFNSGKFARLKKAILHFPGFFSWIFFNSVFFFSI